MNIKLVCVILSSIICLLQPAIGTMNLKNINQTDTAILNEKPIPDFLWTPEWPNISTIILICLSNFDDCSVRIKNHCI